MTSNRDTFRKVLDAKRQDRDERAHPEQPWDFDKPAHWHRRQGRQPPARQQGRRSS